MTNAHRNGIAFLLALLLVASGCALSVQAQGFNSIWADPTSIATGQSTTISWNFPDSYCTSSHFDTGGLDGGSVVVYPASSRNYTISCTGSPPTSVYVTVTATGPSTATISANPTSVVAGNSAVLTWSSNTDSCTGTNFSTGGAPSGSASVTPSETTTYYISCTGPGGSTSASVVVGVTQPPFNAACSANKSSASVGESVTWSASAYNGTAPYTYEWSGEEITGLTGSSVSVSYSLPGAQQASVNVRDSSNSGSGTVTTRTDNRRCTGTALTGNLLEWQAEDGGTQSEVINMLMNQAQDIYQVDGEYFSYPIPSGVRTNPQNYCVEGKVMQRCNPDNWNFGPGACNFTFDLKVHQGPESRVTQDSDWDSIFYDVGDQGSSNWRKTRYYGVAHGTISAGTETIEP